jgi:hypothetical protein
MLGGATPETSTCWSWGRRCRTFELLKKVTDRVPGCMSGVYVVGRRAGDAGHPRVPRRRQRRHRPRLIAILTSSSPASRGCAVV